MFLPRGLRRKRKEGALERKKEREHALSLFLSSRLGELIWIFH